MKRTGTAPILHFPIYLLLVVGAWAQPSQGMTDEADQSFRSGDFQAAEKAYQKVLSSDPENQQALLQLGRLALLGNRFAEAEKWLIRALELHPDTKEAKELLAEAYYRQDNFARAARWLRSVGSDARATQLESFTGQRPYLLEGEGRETHLRFVITDPLPVVRVRVNGEEEANFIIDTGAAEVILDTEFAAAASVKTFGEVTGTFAGGRQATVRQGRVDSLSLGDFVVRNVPVDILSTRRFTAAAGGRRVDGILGTVLFYHFLTTLDYARGELVLRRRTPETLREFEAAVSSDQQIVVPFWLAGTHFVVARGGLNHKGPFLFYVDTGLAGAAFTAPRSTLQEANVPLDESVVREGMGGGGKIVVMPFPVEELSLGEARLAHLNGYFGPFPESIEYSSGFRIAGIISHAFFRPFALTFDFERMRLFLRKTS